MKKMLLFACMIFAAISAFAQDIIVTRDARRIEARIHEVSDTEIKYKEFNNLNGPLYIIRTTDINTIIYQNGAVKVYDNARQAAPAAVAASSAVDPSLMMTKSDDFYVLGDLRMDEAQYVEFVKANCTPAYEAYQKAFQLRKTGFTLLGMGIGFAAGGTTFIVLGSIFGATVSSGLGLAFTIPGSIFAGVGGGLLIGSIPCIAVGTVKKNNSYEVYNEVCARPSYATKLEFNLQTSQNGLGVAMRF